MTTIAYKDGVIAYDGRIVRGNVIVTDDKDKKIQDGNLTFFIAGTTSDYRKLISAYKKGRSREELDACALVLDSGTLFVTSVNEDGLWVSEVDFATPYAIGSGENFALAYMDVGCHAQLAVVRTAERDIYTGGTVRTFEIYRKN